MGRVKLKIKRLENSNGRQTTYAKRKNGILKKANELAILCDIDLILLMFSPTGKPSLCCGKRGVEEVISKFAQMTPQERAKRQLEGLEALKKTFKKLDHDVNIQDFLGASTQTVEGLTEQTIQLRTELEETQQRLSYWSDPSRIESIDHLGQLEESLGKSLDAIRARKENLEKQHLILQETTAQIQNELQMPYRVNLEQHYQPLPWIAPNDAPHIPLAEDPNLIPQREIECAANSSFAAYSSYLDLCKRAQSGAFRDDSGFLSELGRSSPLGQLINGQYSLPSYSSNLMGSNTKYPGDTNLQNSFHLEPQPTFGTHPAFDTNHTSWPPTSGPFADAIHSSWASPCGPLVDGVWGSPSGPCAATTTSGNWASPGSYPVALFDEHYQPH
uniref:MADS-box domain-containing protein n=1 Tax=Kalanchoe fedtschenkoi TaxID=63787 RepID=A0A7N0V6C4_KALFE